MHRHLYTSSDKLSDRDLRHYAREIQLDLDRFDGEMSGSLYADQICKGLPPQHHLRNYRHTNDLC